jgi:transposase-like protein
LRREAAQLGIHQNVLAAWQRQFDKGNWSKKPGEDLTSEQQKSSSGYGVRTLHSKRIPRS